MSMRTFVALLCFLLELAGVGQNPGAQVLRFVAQLPRGEVASTLLHDARGNSFAAFVEDGTIRLWSFSQKAERAFRVDGLARSSQTAVCRFGAGDTGLAVLHPDGRLYLLACDLSGAWDVRVLGPGRFAASVGETSGRILVAIRADGERFLVDLARDCGFLAMGSGPLPTPLLCLEFSSSTQYLLETSEGDSVFLEGIDSCGGLQLPWKVELPGKPRLVRVISKSDTGARVVIEYAAGFCDLNVPRSGRPELGTSTPGTGGFLSPDAEGIATVPVGDQIEVKAGGKVLLSFAATEAVMVRRIAKVAHAFAFATRLVLVGADAQTASVTDWPTWLLRDSRGEGYLMLTQVSPGRFSASRVSAKDGFATESCGAIDLAKGIAEAPLTPPPGEIFESLEGLVKAIWPDRFLQIDTFRDKMMLLDAAGLWEIQP